MLNYWRKNLCKERRKSWIYTQYYNNWLNVSGVSVAVPWHPAVSVGACHLPDQAQSSVKLSHMTQE